MTRHAILDPSFEHKLFDVQREAVRQIIENISEFPDDLTIEQNADRYLVNYVTTLLGQRGAGKTTVMLQVRHELEALKSERGWLTTEMFIPDVLHSPDALGPAIFDVIYSCILNECGNQNDKIEFVNEILMPLRDNLAWFSNVFVPNDIIARDSVSAKHFARSVFKYHVESKDLHRQFSAAIERCINKLNLNKIILLIDDVDINISMVGKVLDMIRYALSSPKIVTVFSCDYTTLRRRLFNERLETLHIDKLPETEVSFFGGTGEAFKVREIESERDYVDAFLTKLLPPSTRVSLRSTSAEELVEHTIGASKKGSQPRTIASLVDAIELQDARRKSNVAISELIKRYPNVLDTNLRGFVNQVSQISLIFKNYQEPNPAFFGLIEDPANPKGPETELYGGALQLNGSISELDEAALVHVLRTFLSSSHYADWLDGLAYFGILDISNEKSLEKIINAVISRANVVGSAIDSFVFSVTSANDERIQMKKKAETHIFHVIIDLAIILGGDISTIYRFLNATPGEGFRHYFLSEAILNYLNDSSEKISKNVRIISGSQKKNLAGQLAGCRSDQSGAPIFVSNSGDMAVHMHRTVNASMVRRIDKMNSTFSDILKDDKASISSVQTAQINQFYAILYSLMDLCTDQIVSAYGIVFNLKPTDIGPATKLSITSHTHVVWGVVRPLNGWGVLKDVFERAGDHRTHKWDRVILFFLHLAQMPYEPMFACFASSGEVIEEREYVRRRSAELRSFIADRGWHTSKGWIQDTDFRGSVQKAGDLPKLDSAMALWPLVSMHERGSALIRFLDFLERDRIDLPADADLQNSPPPIWKAWVDEFAEYVESQRKTEEADSEDDDNDDKASDS